MEIRIVWKTRISDPHGRSHCCIVQNLINNDKNKETLDIA